jgi:hypothetical protein
MMLKSGFWIAVVSATPLLLYALLGPRDGNPIGLGLLFFFGVPFGLLAMGAGLVQRLIGR